MAEVQRHAAHLPVSVELLTESGPSLTDLMSAALRGDLPTRPPRPDPPTPAGHLALLAATDGPLRAVVELHAPQWGSWWTCAGCDFDGYDGEPPAWPCRTAEAVAEALGVELREGRDA